MARRKSGEPKKRKNSPESGLSRKSYSTLKKNAENARRRIRNINAKFGDIVVNPNDYKLNSLLKRIENGESSRAINAELRRIRLANYSDFQEASVTSLTGYVIPASKATAIKKAIDKANKNISKARDKYKDFQDLLPNEFSFNKVTSEITGSKGVENFLEDIKLFTPAKLNIVPKFETGEAITLAEYEFNKRILDRENLRRAKYREEMKTSNDGYFMVQNEYESRPIDIQSIPTRDELTRRAEVWNDIHVTNRANQWVYNYEGILNQFETVLIKKGMYNDRIEKRFDFIRSMLEKITNNADAIQFVSTRMPSIDITLFYNDSGEISFADIYSDWVNFNNSWDW